MTPQPVNIAKLKEPKTLVELVDAGNLEALRIDDLKFDHTYQRDLSADLVQRMAEEWDPRVAGAIVVNRRPNGDLHVIDGQHRTAAAKTAGETHILALVFADLERKSEAGMRVKGNVRRPDTPQEKYRARLAAGDKTALAIKEICDQFDTKINTSPMTKTGMNAIGTVEQLYSKDEGMLLTRVFDIIRRAWGNVGGDHAQVSTLKGIAWLLEHNSEKLDTNHLVDRLQAEGSVGILRKAYSHQAAHQGAIWINWYRAVVEVYNIGLPESKRLEWRFGGKRSGGAGQSRLYGREESANA